MEKFKSKVRSHFSTSSTYVRPSKKALSLRERDGCRSLRSAFASIWRMRSRVTANDCPTSSRVCSLPSSRPNRILITFSSRGVSVFNTEEVCSFKFKLMTASDGETTALSSMKSPKCESRSEEHTSELQSPCNLVCRLLLE